jgi:hypothetical protein
VTRPTIERLLSLVGLLSVILLTVYGIAKAFQKAPPPATCAEMWGDLHRLQWDWSKPRNEPVRAKLEADINAMQNRMEEKRCTEELKEH